MRRSESLWMLLQGRPDRSCNDSPGGWAKLQGKRQARAREEICRACPALDLCREYADSLDLWQKLGTIGGETYGRVLKCAGCGKQFPVSRADRRFCSERCAGGVRYVT